MNPTSTTDLGGPCPDELELERYAASEASKEVSTRVERHIEACPECNGWLARARADDELLAPLLGRPGGRGTARDVISGLGDVEDAQQRALARYRIIRVLGAGGMGLVYEAEQAQPRRRVALKLVRPGYLSEQLVRRFELEAEVLGRLDHPCIASIYDAGTIGDGAQRRPFFVMELVHGQPLRRWVERAKPDREERLRLFRLVCDAVEHAHQKGVIHRDLKPANILVDHSGLPRIVDFGVARATGADLQSATVDAGSGQIVGTLAYMSPEQIEGDSERVDVRSDVYSLGVVLYELLAEKRPFEFDTTSLAKAAQVILGSEPAPMRAHDPHLRGDLETIVRHALEKDPARRYGSASALAEDVGRYLRREPISARRPSTAYLVTRFTQRHRAFVGGVLAVVLVLTVGGISTGVQYLEARRSEAEAREEAQKAQAVSDFLMKVLVQASPSERQRLDVSIDEVFARAAERVDEDFADAPLTRAELHGTVGWTLMRMRRFDEARPHLEQALEIRRAELGPENLDVARSTASLGELALHVRQRDEADELLRRALDMRLAYGEKDRWLLGTNCEQLAVARYLAGDLEDCRTLYRDAIDHRRATGEDHTADLALVLANYARLLLRERVEPEAADRYSAEALDVLRSMGPGPATPVCEVLGARAVVLASQAELDAALELFAEATDYSFEVEGSANRNVVRDGAEIERWIDAARGELDDSTAEWLRGEVRTLLSGR